MSFLSVVFDSVEAYAPGFKASIIGVDVLTPPDIEKIFGLPGGVCIYWESLPINLGDYIS